MVVDPIMASAVIIVFFFYIYFFGVLSEIKCATTVILVYNKQSNINGFLNLDCSL